MVNLADVYFSDVDGDGDRDIAVDSKLEQEIMRSNPGW